MTDLPLNADTETVARRIVWFKPPDAALANLRHLLAHAFRYATASDMAVLRRYLTDDDLRDALDNAPPGIIDGRPWAYWRLMLDVPEKPLPVRRFG